MLHYYCFIYCYEYSACLKGAIEYELMDYVVDVVKFHIWAVYLKENNENVVDI